VEAAAVMVIVKEPMHGNYDSWNCAS